ncbi:peptide synthetase [Streptomyces rubiginosohelvolus]|uniref:phthiocerol/phthiodiolone dimycocerosyl transferase family protein n=1 Tax=Streptomyces rubiginosohelvolus TaxID=67362 RepID=UPI0037AF5E01
MNGPSQHQQLSVRPLGATERVIDLFVHHNPMQFCLVAELTFSLTPQQLAPALRRIQAQHPLLACRIVGSATPESAFRATDLPIPVEEHPPGTPWQAVVAAEQTRPIAPEAGPLLRASLLPGHGGAILVLTFAHQIADGMAGLRVVADLLSALTGQPPTAGTLPENQERLITPPVPSSEKRQTSSNPGGTEPGMGDAGEFVPFSGRIPHVNSLALDASLTTELISRARQEGASVHAALCAAASLTFHRRGRDHVRILSPVDLRRVLGLPDEVVVRFTSARTADHGQHGDDFWALARHHREALSAQTDPGAVAANSAALVDHTPGSPEEATAMMAVASAADVQITNLGVAGQDTHSPVSVRALWGPAQLTQLRDEHLIGVVTSGGRLRMTELTHDPVPALLSSMALVLAEACAAASKEHSTD